MKAILSLALLVSFGGVASAADDKKEDKKEGKKAAGAVGVWKCEYEIGEMKRTSTLTIKREKDGDKLAGTMDWADQKGEKLKDLKLKDGTLTFSAVRKLMGMEIPIDYTLKVDGDDLKGKGASDVGGQNFEFEIKGKRDKPEKKEDKKEEKGLTVG